MLSARVSSRPISEGSHPPARRAAARAALAFALTQVACLVTVTMARDAAAASPPPPRGALTLLTGPGGCVGSPFTRLRGATALVRIAVSPDGRNLYLSGQAGGLSILARDGRTGRIYQLAGRGGCFRRDARQGCGLLRTLTDPAGLTVTPDGRDVYVTTTQGVLGLGGPASHRPGSTHETLETLIDQPPSPSNQSQTIEASPRQSPLGRARTGQGIVRGTHARVPRA